MNKLVMIALVALAGCATAPSAPAPGGPPPGGSFPTGLDNTCDGERYGTLVGQDATVLERVMILGQVRVVRPGSVVTQDYRPERMNFNIGTDGRIASITCG